MSAPATERTRPAPSGGERGLWVAERRTGTLQGEGPNVGEPSAFIRLSRCNLKCGYCDTPYTWDWERYDPRKESQRVSVTDLGDWALGCPEESIFITGGETLLQQRALLPLVLRLREAGRQVEIETNGTYLPTPELVASGVHFNVSPKLASSSMPERLRIRPAALAALAAAPSKVFKFVACGPQDLPEIDTLVEQHGLTPVMVMPEGRTEEAILQGMRELTPHLLKRGYRLGTRLHVLLWGDERGR
ncbi:7-carboxy-7-deazaguanine synthase QueE [Streptomyces sp. NPDC058471]|uniref:7-carboxy-7-deazaguanine synthase QueE n=1 Tax=Streptomyces sp. NPDC058471 TaxID=3346516 RepID=UPI0036531C3B